MNKRSIILVIDGFGIGAMGDSESYRIGESKANTLESLLKVLTWDELPNLRKLGLEKVVNDNLNGEVGFFGKSKLGYFGADSYFGHQEINGSIIPRPYVKPLKSYLDTLIQKIKDKGFSVELKKYQNESILIVNNSVVISDNIETDLGQVINVNGIFDITPYDKVLEIGEIVRSIVEVTRVIVIGANNIKLDNFLDNILEKGGGYIGIDTPKSGVYNDSYMCKHLGLELDETIQLPFVLNGVGIKSYLIAKFGDLVFNPVKENSFNIANTDEIFTKTFEIIEKTNNENCFIGVNIQETDLSGHSMDLKRFVKTLIKVDNFIGELITKLNENDLLIVCADHGNDPEVGHTNHTREYVPVLIYNKKIDVEKKLGLIENLNSIGQTAANWLDVELKNGTDLIKNKCYK